MPIGGLRLIGLVTFQAGERNWRLYIRLTQAFSCLRGQTALQIVILIHFIHLSNKESLLVAVDAAVWFSAALKSELRSLWAIVRVIESHILEPPATICCAPTVQRKHNIDTKLWTWKPNTDLPAITEPPSHLFLEQSQWLDRARGWGSCFWRAWLQSATPLLRASQ